MYRVILQRENPMAKCSTLVKVTCDQRTRAFFVERKEAGDVE